MPVMTEQKFLILQGDIGPTLCLKPLSNVCEDLRFTYFILARYFEPLSRT